MNTQAHTIRTAPCWGGPMVRDPLFHNSVKQTKQMKTQAHSLNFPLRRQVFHVGERFSSH